MITKSAQSRYCKSQKNWVSLILDVIIYDNALI